MKQLRFARIIECLYLNPNMYNYLVKTSLRFNILGKKICVLVIIFFYLKSFIQPLYPITTMPNGHWNPRQAKKKKKSYYGEIIKKIHVSVTLISQ